jgi:hypothetical protein
VVAVWVRELEATVVLLECVGVERDAIFLAAVLEAVTLCAAVLDALALVACDFAVLDALPPELV